MSTPVCSVVNSHLVAGSVIRWRNRKVPHHEVKMPRPHLHGLEQTQPYTFNYHSFIRDQVGTRECTPANTLAMAMSKQTIFIVKIANSVTFKQLSNNNRTGNSYEICCTEVMDCVCEEIVISCLRTVIKSNRYSVNYRTLLR